MSQHTAPDGDLQRRTQRTAHRLTGMTYDEVAAVMRDSAKAVAEQLVEQGIPVDTGRFRPDVGPVQVDMIVIQEKISNPEPGMRLQFDIEASMGVTLTIKLLEFLKDPAQYVRDLFEQLGPMRRNVLRMRAEKRDRNSKLYDALTKGGAHG